jgi:uncharacterized protein (DUF1697 family)
VALVAFLRAVNVGGRTCPVRELADALGLVNLGAAGTFVAPGEGGADALERAIRRRLPFETEVMVCPGEEILRLAGSDPFGARDAPPDAKRAVTVLARAPRGRLPPLPIEWPEGDGWSIRVTAVVGRYALSLRRRVGPRGVYPNELVERSLGVAATTRGWETIERIRAALEAAPARPPRRKHHPRGGRRTGR